MTLVLQKRRAGGREGEREGGRAGGREGRARTRAAFRHISELGKFFVSEGIGRIPQIDLKHNSAGRGFG